LSDAQEEVSVQRARCSFYHGWAVGIFFTFCSVGADIPVPFPPTPKFLVSQSGFLYNGWQEYFLFPEWISPLDSSTFHLFRQRTRFPLVDPLSLVVPSPLCYSAGLSTEIPGAVLDQGYLPTIAWDISPQLLAMRMDTLLRYPDAEFAKPWCGILRRAARPTPNPVYSRRSQAVTI